MDSNPVCGARRRLADVSLLTELERLKPIREVAPLRRENSLAVIKVHKIENGLSLPTKTEILNSLSTPVCAADRPPGWSGIDIQHLADAVGRVILEIFIHPFQRIMVGLTDPPKYPVIVSGPQRWMLEPSMPLVSRVST